MAFVNRSPACDAAGFVLAVLVRAVLLLVGVVLGQPEASQRQVLVLVEVGELVEAGSVLIGPRRCAGEISGGGQDPGTGRVDGVDRRSEVTHVDPPGLIEEVQRGRPVVLGR